MCAKFTLEKHVENAVACKFFWHATCSMQRAAWERWRGKGMGAATLIYGLHATALHMDATAALQRRGCQWR